MLVFAAVLVAAAFRSGLWMARVYLERGARARRAGVPSARPLRRRSPGAGGRYAGVTARLQRSSRSIVLFLRLLAQGWLPLNPNGFPGVPAVPGSAHRRELRHRARTGSSTPASRRCRTGSRWPASRCRTSRLPPSGWRAPRRDDAASPGSATEGLGNFWVDLYRSLVYVLLPLAFVGALVLVSQGVPQTLAGHAVAATVEGAEQSIARGPVATQVAIRHSGTNGGGFYNTNAATPFENPNGLTNASSCCCSSSAGRLRVHVRADGRLAPAVVRHPRGHAGHSRPQGWSPRSRPSCTARRSLRASGVATAANMEDKEVRFGVAGSAFFTSCDDGRLGKRHRRGPRRTDSVRRRRTARRTCSSA